MIAQYKRNTNLGVGLGIAMQVLSNSLANNGLLGWLVFGAGFILFIWGCGQYAKGKGYSAYFGALGLLSIVGLVVLVVFPDKFKDA